MANGPIDLKKLFSGKKATTILCIVGFIGIALIFLSDFFSSSSKPQQQSASSSDTPGAYELDTEDRLEDIIGRIDGVGRVKVMVTVESGVENIYETDNKISDDVTRSTGDSAATQQSTSSESSHVIVDNGGDGEQALLSKQEQPEILGVVVVCDGGNSPDVKENVVDSVSTALGLATNHITVVKMAPS